MRKRVFGRRLKRTTNQRKGLFRSLMRSMIVYGHIKTTEAKAKAVRGEIEKVVTRARGGDGAYRNVLKVVAQPDLAEKLIKDIAPVFADRPGGYTRMVKLGNRVKDNAPMVYMEWVETIVSSGNPSQSSGQAKGQSKKVEKTEAMEAEVIAPEEKKEKKESKKAPRAKKEAKAK